MEINVISVWIIILHKIKKMGFNVNIVVILSRIALNVKFRIGAINVIRDIIIGLEIVLKIGSENEFLKINYFPIINVFY